MKNNEWRFKGNNFTTDTGLNTTDMYTFMENPLASFTRECFQNSNDARMKDKNKVIVKVSRFDIKKEEIPGYERLLEEVNRCIKYQKEKSSDDKDTLSGLEKIRLGLKTRNISCLKFSDYNTKGLEGVYDTLNSPFYMLTKGSGTSAKVGTDGGSKGVGKYAAFVESEFNTVFYSTLNKEGEEAYIGISKLCSARIPNSKERTMGIGYFGSDDENNPIKGQFVLGNNKKRTEPGTDIYVLGFDEFIINWKKNMIKYLLESFLVAIFYERLEAEIDGTTINKDNLEKIINSMDDGKDKKIIASQLYLLQGKNNEKEVLIGDYGKVTFYGAVLEGEDKKNATMKCTYVRYPYMRIMESPKLSKSTPISMLCIIGNDDLNKKLRSIENAQHTSWMKSLAKKLNNDADKALKLLEEATKEFYEELTKSRSNTITDLQGAGDYLPFEGDVDENGKNATKPVGKVIVGKRKIKPKMKPAIGGKGNGIEPDLGGKGNKGNDGGGNGKGNGKGKKDSGKGNGNKPTGDDGIEPTNKPVDLSGMYYKFFITNKEKGEAIICFDSKYDEEDCELHVYRVDDSDNKEEIKVNECYINNSKSDKSHFKLEKNKTKIRIVTDIKELYACEVKIYANRK